MIEDKLTPEEWKAFKKATTGLGRTKLLCDTGKLYRSNIKNIKDKKGRGTDVVLVRVRKALEELNYLTPQKQTA